MCIPKSVHAAHILEVVLYDAYVPTITRCLSLLILHNVFTVIFCVGKHAAFPSCKGKVVYYYNLGTLLLL